jgi:hypothetical protein
VEAKHQEFLKAYITNIAHHEGILNPQPKNAREV